MKREKIKYKDQFDKTLIRMVRIVTESFSDVPPHIAESYNITILPAEILFGKEVFHESTNLSQEGFYTLLSSKDYYPVVNSPDVKFLYDTFKPLVVGGEELLYISSDEDFQINSKLAFKYLKPGELTIINLQLPSMYQGVISIQASIYAQFGYNSTEIVEFLEDIKTETVGYLFTDGKSQIQHETPPKKSISENIKSRIKNLRHAYRRKKVYSINQEKFTLKSKYFNFENSFISLMEEIKKKYAKDEPIIASVIHFDARLEASTIISHLTEYFTSMELIQTKFGTSYAQALKPKSVMLVISPLPVELVS